MIDINTLLRIIIYISCIILLVIGIILEIRLLRLTEKTDRILTSIENKVNSLNGIFNIIDKTTNSIEMIGNKVIDKVTNLFTKLFKKKKEEDYYE